VSFRRFSIPAALFLQLAILPAAEPAPRERDRAAVILHGSRSAYRPSSGTTDWGYGAGGSIIYYARQHFRYWAGVDRDRDPQSGRITPTLTSYALGVEFGTRRPHRVEPYSRLGLGVYNIHVKLWYPDLLTGVPVTYERDKNKVGLNFGFGIRARPGGRTLVELGLAEHLIFPGEGSEAPNLNSEKLLQLNAGLGYTFH
jgi:hypothetical protein